MSKCKGRNSPTTNKCLHGWSLAKKPHKRLTFVPHIRNVKTLVQISLLTSCSLTHPSSQTSFPRQDLKTSIVLEFIKVLDGSFRCFLSDLTESVEANGPACGSALIKKGVQVQLQLAASATLISGTHTHREGRRWSTAGARCQQAGSKRACLPVFSQTLPPPPPSEGAVLLFLTHTSSAFQWSCVLSVCGYGSKADCWRRCQALQPIIKPGIHTGHTCLQDLSDMHCTSLQQKLLTDFNQSLEGEKSLIFLAKALSKKEKKKKQFQTLSDKTKAV